MTFSQFENEFQRALEELYREYYPRALSLAERISSDPVEISKNIIHHFEPRDGIEKSIKLFRKFVWMLTGTLLDLEPDLAELTEEQKEKWK